MLEIKYPGGAGLEVRSALSDGARSALIALCTASEVQMVVTEYPCSSLILSLHMVFC